MTQVRSHTEFLTFMTKQIDVLYPNKRIIKEHFTDHVIWTSLMDLTPTAELLKHRYSSDPRGRKPRNPCDMLRSLLLMHNQNITSVDKWVFTLKSNPLLAILSGFTPGNVPGVGTFYDFFNRLWLAPTPHFSKNKKRKLKKPRTKGKKNQKLAPKNPNIVQKLVNRALKRKKIHYTDKAFDQLQILFQSMFVNKSA